MTKNTVSTDKAAPVLTRQHALFLDFDGTLAPLQDDPETVTLPDNGSQYLLKMAGVLGGALVLISGRDIRDLASRVPDGLWRAGGHGLEICPPDKAPAPQRETVDARFLTAITEITDRFEAVRIETKGKVLAIHYRQAPSAGPALAEALASLTRQIPDYHFQHGKMVIELKPKGANKGTAIKSLMHEHVFKDRIPVMIGDDTTDEDAMAVATELGGYGIKVGIGDTCARYRFSDTEAVWQWLRRIVHEHA